MTTTTATSFTFSVPNGTSQTKFNVQHPSGDTGVTISFYNSLVPTEKIDIFLSGTTTIPSTYTHYKDTVPNSGEFVFTLLSPETILYFVICSGEMKLIINNLSNQPIFTYSDGVERFDTIHGVVQGSNYFSYNSCVVTAPCCSDAVLEESKVTITTLAVMVVVAFVIGTGTGIGIKALVDFMSKKKRKN